MKIFASFLIVSTCLLSSCYSGAPTSTPSEKNAHETIIKEQMDKLNSPVLRNERILGQPKNPYDKPPPSNPARLA